MTRILVVDNGKALGKGMHGEVYACSWQDQGDDQKLMVVKVPLGTNCPQIILIEDHAHTKGFFISTTATNAAPKKLSSVFEKGKRPKLYISIEEKTKTDVEDFKREWLIAKLLWDNQEGKPRHIAHYIAFGLIDPQIPCLVMQRYTATLKEIMMTDKDLRWQTVLEHVLLAIDYITRVCGVQHHDIRTDNIMTYYGDWYVCDFGEAKIEEGKSKEEMRREDINFFATNLYKKLMEYKDTNRLSEEIFREPKNKAPYLYYLRQCAKLQDLGLQFDEQEKHEEQLKEQGLTEEKDTGQAEWWYNRSKAPDKELYEKVFVRPTII